MVEMYLIITVAILGMILFYSLIAYFLIRFISKKAFKLTLTKYEMMEIITWLAVLFITFMMIKMGSIKFSLAGCSTYHSIDQFTTFQSET
ncbi:hypothetical protein FE296_10175 [Paenibacillus sp. UASWS1643]|nr:hypothetical protein FE296_10175 [Paenibacillus sp. UASWS1643]